MWIASLLALGAVAAECGESRAELGRSDGVRSADRYEVFALPKEYPDDGPRTVEVDPASAGGDASPFGWHDTDGLPGAEHTITRGNNVYAYTDIDADDAPDPGGSPDGGPDLEFLFPLDLGAPPEENRAAAVTNAFYWLNVAHDVLYRHGFDEAAGNFQENNYDRGGLGGDAVLVEVQDGGFTNGLTIVTPPDGEPPRIELAVFTLTGIHRDSAFSSYALLYAYGHATARRLVGGPSQVGCLSSGESAGVLIGFADWLALALTAAPSDAPATHRGVGTWLFGQPPDGPGIRPRPYSTDFALNDLTYDAIRTLQHPFGTGTVWATIVWQVYWELVAAHGFQPDIYADWTAGGNNLALRLVVDALQYCPCPPGFIDFRDAMLAADDALTSGANRCAIWRGFAARGLGHGASQGSPGSLTDGVESFELPPECLASSVESADDAAGGEEDGSPEIDGARPGSGGSPAGSGRSAFGAVVVPNPSNGAVSLHYAVPRAGQVSLEIFDTQGRSVARLVDGWRSAGTHASSWDGRDTSGGRAAPGVYFVRLESGESSESLRLIRLP